MPDRPPALLGPWPVVPHRVSRFYRGGALLDAFRARTLPERQADRAGLRIGAGTDTDRPEDWVASATSAWQPPGAPASREGLAAVVVDGREVPVHELLRADPQAVAGAPLVARAGATTGLLVKLLDAAVRLPVHAHPTRAFARRRLGSFFGKAEAWIVLATREVEGEPPPNIRLGFTRDVGRDELRDLIERERTEDLLGLLHERPIRPGDAWFVPPGTPHAIGAGALILELQEPSDFSIVAETRGLPIDPEDAHLRLGWDVMLDAFDRRGLDDAGLAALRGPAAADGDAGEAFEARRLTPPAADPYLRAIRWRVRGEGEPGEAPAFLVALVTEGEGEARVDGGAHLPLRTGDTFAVPAAGLPGLRLSGDLTLVACLPPTPDALALDDPADGGAS